MSNSSRRVQNRPMDESNSSSPAPTLEGWTAGRLDSGQPLTFVEWLLGYSQPWIAVSLYGEVLECSTLGCLPGTAATAADVRAHLHEQHPHRSGAGADEIDRQLVLGAAQCAEDNAVRAATAPTRRDFPMMTNNQAALIAAATALGGMSATYAEDYIPALASDYAAVLDRMDRERAELEVTR